MTKLQPGEQDAIRKVLVYGMRYGYGNLIAHLQTAWARHLMESGIDENYARHATGPGYSFALWDDLVKNGEWDETGKRYKEKEKRD